MLPPKDPYIECQVLREAGAMLLDDKVVHLTPNTRHFIKRAEAEPLIMQVRRQHSLLTVGTSNLFVERMQSLAPLII
jgi:hypothetical protein